MTQQLSSSSSSQNINRVTFSQKEDVLIISELENSSQFEPLFRPDLIKKISVQFADHSVQEFLVDKSVCNNFPAKSHSFYFCVPCSSRFPDQAEFLVHCDQMHSVQVQETGDLTLMTSDQTILNGYSKPEEMASSSMASQFMMNMSQQMLNGELMKFMRAQQFPQSAPFVQRNSSKTLKCPKCNWHYKYQETLEIHMKEKHNDLDVKCIFCLQNQAHPKLARGESYSCGYKPYRCELCKYSTTTKGNLSIHMQSDKHLHAVQEMPSNIGQQTPMNPLELTSDKVFSCLICNNFRTNSSAELWDHLDRDRNTLAVGDVSMINGFYHCHLCPYNTNLKANFQLHTKTDKHIQRVQLINHMRENSGPITPNSLMNRLAAAKTTVQVRCGVCQEILTCTTSLREHIESRIHLHRASVVMLHSASANPSPGRRGSALISSQNNPGGIEYECVICGENFDDQSLAAAHIPQCSQTSNNVDKVPEPSTSNAEWTANAERLMSMGEVAFYCKDCDFLTTTLEQLQSHEKAGDHSSPTDPRPCPLCTRKPNTPLKSHLLEAHNIADEVAEELMASIPISAAGKEIVGLYRHRCAHCPLVFKHGEQLKSHELTHSFRVNHKCPNCTRTFSSVLLLLQHQQDEHSELKCELCSATFGDKHSLESHLGSVEHLNRTKQFLEDQPNKLQLNEKVMQLLQRSSEDRESPSDKPKPYKCNVCKLNYSQGSTLDIHLRSVGHQNRMNRLNELVKCGEIDASKPVSEQPGGIPQKPIGDLVDNEKADASDMNSTENPVNFMNILNMAQFMQLAQNPSTSATDSGLDLSENNGIDLSSILNGEDAKSEEKPKPRKLGQDFRRSLEGYGFELVAQFVDDLKKEKIDFIADNEILELRQQFDDINKNSVPIDGIQQFAENLKKAVDEVSDDVLIENEDEDGPPEPKRARSDNPKALGPKLPEGKPEFKAELMSQMMNLPFMNNNPFVNMSPDMFQAAFASMLGAQAAPDSPSANSASQKRARTRITDDQLKVLRQYFDINNSPTEIQIKEMSNKTGLPEKVIKHWFRNTLFKERQRDKNSPYNFNVQPMMRIDLDTYEKTGEAKIINLKDEEDQKPDDKSDSGSKTPEEQSSLAQDVLANLTQAAAAFNQIPNYAALAGQNPFASFLDQESSQMNQNPLAQLMNGFNSVIPMVSQQSKSSGNSTGRRANRTRFTDFQLRTLQEFFDRQAYPKDDDLEMLSKKLSLSPRVIVVWFQNARQKARKIYENQPNQDNTDRFIRTPGCNFQCKRCQLVFQRYYELIQHQQRVCYANDTDAQNTDNKSVEENMTEEERQKPVSSSQPDEDKRKDSHDNNNTPQDLLKLITGAADSEALMKMFANQGQHKKFSKRCPFCANLFTSKDSMNNHIAHQHSDNPLATTVNVDNLPEADDSLSTTEGLLGTISALTGGSPLDLRQKDTRKSSSPFDDLIDNQEADEFSSNGSFDFRALSASPHALLSAFGSPLGSAMGSGMQRSPANGSSASQGGPKRYRTHLTPLQVYVMKSLFTDYKTPSMSECEVLGREIGLHKRVVQVWFQNARAKQRKCGMGAITEEGLCSTHPTGCVECGIDFNGRLTIQDHIFSSQHIGKVKEKGAELRGNEESIERPKSMKRDGEDGGPSEDVALNPLLYTLMDPNMLGTPIQCLQIPEKVMTQIAADLAKGNLSTVFTQDGLELPNLALKVSDEDFKCGTIVESEVGWACPQCSQVFQQEMWLKNHQKLICQGCDGIFRLIQQHYECIPCGQKFGTQDDYQSHCDQSSHKTKRQVFQSPSTCSTSSI